MISFDTEDGRKIAIVISEKNVIEINYTDSDGLTFNHTSDGNDFTISQLVYDDEQTKLVEGPRVAEVFFAQFKKESELEGAAGVLEIPSLELAINVKKDVGLEY